jgi:signal transduction histidine kinase
MNPLLAQLTHRAFPEVAEIIRSGADQITREWDVEVRRAMPQMKHLTFDELKDSTPEILLAISDALASEDPELIGELIARAPAQGLSRFRLNFDVIEVMQEDRLLRAITVRHVETFLGRPMESAESAALHAAIDVMLQRSVVALVEQQKVELRSAAETELKFLSFLSHDLNNNLQSVTMSLESLRYDLLKTNDFPGAIESLARAQQCIHDTVAGMRQLLDHERLRKTGKAMTFSAVDLHAAASKAAHQFMKDADAKGTKVVVAMKPGIVIESDAELLSLVLQNLVGNGVKYSSGGEVRIGFGGGADADHPVLWVSDDGPGIATEKLGTIFSAFRRGEVHGTDGLGLGLAIASEAATLLGAKLTVESKLGLGSTFRLNLPKTGGKPGSNPATSDRLAGIMIDTTAAS